MQHEDIIITVKNLMQEITRGFHILEKNVSVSCGITPSQWSTLLAFDDKNALKMNELSKRLALATSTMTRMIDNLVKEGLVERKPDFADRRLVMVHLTKEGKRLAQRLHKLQSEYFNTLLDHIDADMRGQVVTSLNNLLLAFRKFEVDNDVYHP
ncbi:MAG TPA: MarR family transcriptional regulator [Candidatus Brocadiales bacterium]|nr:MarR family transcriptional regulator [Candidatus Brocadiales bacterium]